jgi:hypothetical protein
MRGRVAGAVPFRMAAYPAIVALKAIVKNAGQNGGQLQLTNPFRSENYAQNSLDCGAKQSDECHDGNHRERDKTEM